jgi:lipopolysaccharide heptosyltransferase II
MKINPTEIKKILLIKPRGIGDIVLSTIVLENLHNYFSGVKIDYLTEHFAKYSVLYNALVHKVLVMHKTEFVLKTALKIRKEKYDMVIDLWSNPRSAQVTFLSQVKHRVGFAYRGRKYAYNILGTSEKGEHHSAEHNLELLKAISVPIISKNIHYTVRDSDRSFADNFFNENIKENKLIFGIIPSGSWDSKRCTKSKWLEICNAAIKSFKCKVLVLWGPGDESDAEFIKNNLGDQCYIAPKSNLLQLGALISKCDVIISNDSGPMHIAAAIGVPTIGLFGPTNPRGHRPYSLNSDYVINDKLDCICCDKLICPLQHECMTELNTADVIAKINSLLNKYKTI